MSQQWFPLKDFCALCTLQDRGTPRYTRSPYWHNCTCSYNTWFISSISDLVSCKTRLCICSLFILPRHGLVDESMHRQLRDTRWWPSCVWYDIDYADDVVLFNTEPATWNEILKNYESVANSLGMHCNWQKIKLQNIGSGHHRYLLKLMDRRQNLSPNSLTLLLLIDGSRQRPIMCLVGR